MSINIPATIKDIHYRYKRSPLDARIIKNKTIITNWNTIAAQLNASPTFIMNYISKKIGAQVNGSIINGKHDTAKLETTIESFIAKYVLCKKCKYPELTSDRQYCRACGWSAKIRDMHKHSTNDCTYTNNDNNNDCTSASDKTVWSLDTSKEAIIDRRENLPENIKRLTTAAIDDTCNCTPSSLMQAAINAPHVTVAELYQATQFIKNIFNMSDRDCICMLYELLIMPGMNNYDDAKNRIQKYGAILKKFISTAGEKIIIGYLEEHINASINNDMLCYTASYMLLFYRAGLISADVAKSWHTGTPSGTPCAFRTKKKSKFVADNSRIRIAAKPFIKWLSINDGA